MALAIVLWGKIYWIDCLNQPDILFRSVRVRQKLFFDILKSIRLLKAYFL